MTGATFLFLFGVLCLLVAFVALLLAVVTWVLSFWFDDEDEATDALRDYADHLTRGEPDAK